MGKLLLYAVAVLAGLAMAGPAWTQTTGNNPSHEDILRGFDISALYADTSQGTTGFGAGATMTGVLTKWDRTIAYSLNGLLYDNTRIKETVDALNRMAGIAGLETREVQPESGDANFRIVFRNSENLRTSNGGKAGCLTSWKYDKWTGRMIGAELQINLAYINGISHCIIHEMLHAFGLRGHPHKLHSIMSYYTSKIVFDLTEADMVMLQTLYDPRMKLGLPRLSAAALADDIIEEKRRALNPAAPPRSDPAPVFRDIVASLEKEAEAGGVHAMLHLAEAYRVGSGVTPSRHLHRQWLQRAMSHPDPKERFDAAYALHFGRILPVNHAQALLLYEEIARSGINAAQNNLGHMLRNGHGAPANKVEAMKWFILAAQAGNALAGKNRDSLLPQLTPEEHAEAQKRAAEWQPVQQAAR